MGLTEVYSAQTRDRIINALMGTTLTREDAIKIAEVLIQCVAPDDLNKSSNQKRLDFFATAKLYK